MFNIFCFGAPDGHFPKHLQNVSKADHKWDVWSAKAMDRFIFIQL